MSDPNSVPDAFDVIVVGAGGAGTLAAVVAADRGARVLLLEKDSSVISNTGICGGLVPGAGTPWQAAAGVEDSPDRMFADVMAKNDGRADPRIVRLIAERSRDVIAFLSSRLGLRIHLYTGILHPGLSAHRLHASPGETGAELIDALRRAVRASANTTFLDHATVDGLIHGPVGVEGVTVRQGAAVRRFTAARVLLACSGFGADPAMIRQYCPEIDGAMNLGSLSATGDGIRWGKSAGAALAHMSGYQGHCHANPVEGTHLGGSLPRLGAIIVNLEGRRFGPEDAGYSEFARDVLAQPGGRAVEIFDQTIYDAAYDLGPFREAVEHGAVKRAMTLAALAAQFGLPADALAAEIDAFHEAIGRGSDRFGRRVFGRPLQAPYYGSLVTGAMAHTQGGLRIDTRCRVLRDDGTPIAGLYAAGGTAAGISGDGASGYLSGNGLAHAFVTGLVAGEAMTAR